MAFGEEEINIQSIEGIRVEQIRTEAFAEEDIFLIIEFTTIEKSNASLFDATTIWNDCDFYKTPIIWLGVPLSPTALLFEQSPSSNPVLTYHRKHF